MPPSAPVISRTIYNLGPGGRDPTADEQSFRAAADRRGNPLSQCGGSAPESALVGVRNRQYCLRTQNSKMRKALVCLMMLSLTRLMAAQTDGTPIEQSPCPPKIAVITSNTLRRQKAAIRERLRAPKPGINLEVPGDLSKRILSAEACEQRKAYAGIDCQRIKYLSDGLIVKGANWSPGWPTDFTTSFRTVLL